MKLHRDILLSLAFSFLAVSTARASTSGSTGDADARFSNLMVSTASDPPSICDAVMGNLVTNCGLEGGVYSSTIGGHTNGDVPNGWTPNEEFDAGWGGLTSISNSGNYALFIGDFDDEPAPTLSQTLVDTSGITYSGTLYVDYGGASFGDSGAFFDVIVNSTTVLSLNGTASGTYTQYNFSFVGTGSDVLTIEGNTNPSEWLVDDIVVQAPEAATLVLLAAGLMVIAVRRRWPSLSSLKFAPAKPPEGARWYWYRFRRCTVKKALQSSKSLFILSSASSPRDLPRSGDDL